MPGCGRARGGSTRGRRRRRRRRVEVVRRRREARRVGRPLLPTVPLPGCGRPRGDSHGRRRRRRRVEVVRRIRPVRPIVPRIGRPVLPAVQPRLSYVVDPESAPRRRRRDVPVEVRSGSVPRLFVQRHPPRDRPVGNEPVRPGGNTRGGTGHEHPTPNLAIGRIELPPVRSRPARSHPRIGATVVRRIGVAGIYQFRRQSVRRTAVVGRAVRRSGRSVDVSVLAECRGSSPSSESRVSAESRLERNYRGAGAGIGPADEASVGVAFVRRRVARRRKCERERRSGGGGGDERPRPARVGGVGRAPRILPRRGHGRILHPGALSSLQHPALRHPRRLSGRRRTAPRFVACARPQAVGGV
mmetsp:Transcript_30690/g.91868  ORF Transcript_30690/g.91868 Transcript_30690/m.91868 type:complete len:357 (+) Transcript_30690:1043-2113(+)